MPSSFSRFLTDEELHDIRALYEESLDGEDEAGTDAVGTDADTVTEPGPGEAEERRGP